MKIMNNKFKTLLLAVALLFSASLQAETIDP